MLEATPETFDQLIQERDKLIVVYFWGTDCPNCDVFKAALPSMMPELSALPIRFISVDAYTHMDLARRFGLAGVPAFLLFRNGDRLGMMREFRGKAFFTAVLRENCPVVPPT